MAVSTRKRGKTWSYYFNIGKTEKGNPKKIERGGFATKTEAETEGIK